AGKPLAASFPGLAGTSDLRFESYGDGTQIAQCDVVFLAQENGKAMETAPHLLEAGCKVIDLSADFRFRDVATYCEWYQMTHAAPQLNAEAVYGLPELFGPQIRTARLIGNPGCYPTATLLALAPLLHHGLVEPKSIIVDAKSGVSGAGRSKFELGYHYPEANESVSAYKVAGTHRHTPEIEQTLSGLYNLPDLRLSFTPHLIPMTRGILATCYGNLRADTNAESVLQLYRDFYASQPFVVVTDGLPATKHTCGSNYCHIGLAVDARTQRLIVLSAIDNLVKGAAGQAIQNMNLMCGWDETAGLKQGGIWP
ncbi:MAG TPA: N-acetyl-gamma-glutamyl-phosphate reductase, partial [Chthonomonadaceae bacterium]|nr:N-acetyl-gamma-glutamyl-phosphate reductase [Chthonomonadaceae bacterium]